ncbi:MAG: bifunctional diguanylate cyclase/phosphodiesterase [Pseudomonadota bacterium]|nr:bifunctional diguanylate cyclase/phosphodiesterase [Pseudomonadota bacterium]
MTQSAQQNDAYEALVQFLYRAPIGLVQIDWAGSVELLNPMASNLLMPLVGSDGLENLYTVLHRFAPELATMAAAFDEPSGVICDALRVPLGDAAGGPGAPEVLAISLLKLDAARLMCVVADATLDIQRERETLAKRLNTAARTDVLTKMPNRAAVREQLGTLLAANRSHDSGEVALLFMNCDRFRQINDTLGQAAGDALLVEFSQRLRALLRPPTDHIGRDNGQMAARLGGDEFVVIMDGMRRIEDVESIAQRLIDNIGRPYFLLGHDITCTISVGVVWGVMDAIDPDEAVRDASIAMVEAKRAGGARYVVFETGMRERAARRGDIEAELRTALQEEQLFVVYQPVVGLLADGSTDFSAGVEALVRWRHPVRGVVPPFEFIEVAEQCGLIGALGDFVLATACRDFVRWQGVLGTAAPRLLAVNLSRAQLAQPHFAATVRAALRDAGMQPSALQLEVTESLAAQDQEIQQRLHELKAIGVTLALDDFGTGYSSLSSLHLLPVDIVKIDRSFVCQADTSAHHRVLIEATVKVAQSLGMGTVAEGIETVEQARAVRELHCAKGQGYLFSRPLMDAALVEWVREHAGEVDMAA